jgi:hypothetical protein
MLTLVSPKFAVTSLIPVFLMIGACGGSTHSGPSSTATSAPSGSTASTVTSTSSTTTTSASAASKPKHFATGSHNVRIPATFIITAGGRLSPPQIAIPAHLGVLVTVVAKDGRSHRVVVRTPSARTLSVPAGGHASTLIASLPVGRYRIELDGAVAGLLITGAQPGP